jgi:ribosomal protein L37AE/L43A
MPPDVFEDAPRCKVCNAEMSVERYYSPTQARWECQQCRAYTRVGPVVRHRMHPWRGAGQKLLREV